MKKKDKKKLNNTPRPVKLNSVVFDHAQLSSLSLTFCEHKRGELLIITKRSHLPFFFLKIVYTHT